MCVAPSPSGEQASAGWQAVYSIAVLVLFQVSSLSQEALSQSELSESTMILVQSFGSVCAALIALSLFEKKETSQKASFWEWSVVIAAYYGSHFFGLMSLRHLSYPVHVTFKSCKPIPVAIAERLLTSKRHSLGKKIGVVVMCLGAAVFLVMDGSSSKKSSTSLVGIAFVCAALVADGLYTGAQVKLIEHCDSEFTLMLFLNVWQGLFSLGVAISRGEISNAFQVVLGDRHQALALAAFAFSKALGTVFVYKLLREAGTLVVATVTTVRKILTVLLSVLYFGHSLAPAQWASLVLVFFHKYIGNAVAAASRKATGATTTTTTKDKKSD